MTNNHSNYKLLFFSWKLNVLNVTCDMYLSTLRKYRCWWGRDGNGMLMRSVCGVEWTRRCTKLQLNEWPFISGDIRETHFGHTQTVCGKGVEYYDVPSPIAIATINITILEAIKTVSYGKLKYVGGHRFPNRIDGCWIEMMKILF